MCQADSGISWPKKSFGVPTFEDGQIGRIGRTDRTDGSDGRIGRLTFFTKFLRKSIMDFYKAQQSKALFE